MKTIFKVGDLVKIVKNNNKKIDSFSIIIGVNTKTIGKSTSYKEYIIFSPNKIPCIRYWDDKKPKLSKLVKLE